MPSGVHCCSTWGDVDLDAFPHQPIHSARLVVDVVLACQGAGVRYRRLC